ncbi:MAG: MgtC/SapB family protein [Clostridiales bacterium]|nr:MgtC/SapB family protein [Clostridiales bacterium]
MIDPIARLLGEWSAEIDIASILLRLAMSIVFAAIIGCERATKRHAAGLRTFMLVSLASTMATMMDVYLIETYGAGVAVISAAAVIGAAIISSNSILFSSKNQIKGLTTSVGLWTSGILGIAIGAGFYSVAVLGFLALICCLSLFPTFETYLKNRSNHFEVHLELTNKNNLQDFVTTLRRLGLRIDDIESNPAYINSGLSVYSVSMTINSPELKKYKTHSEIIQAIGTLDYVYYIEEMN